MTTKRHKGFSSVIKLGPALGDWTRLDFQDAALQSATVGTVQSASFNSLPKASMAKCHYLHYELAQTLTRKFSQDMDIKVELHSIQAVQFSYEEFLKTLDPKIVQSDISVDGIGKIRMFFDWALADMMVNRLTGGAGQKSESEQFSDVESTILEAQIDSIAPYVLQHWALPEEFRKTHIDVYCGAPEQDKKVTLREAFIAFEIQFYFGKDQLQKMIIAYSNEVLKFLFKNWEKNRSDQPKTVSLKQETMSGLTVGIAATLGKTRISMKDLKQLRVGDLIPLNHSIFNPIELSVGDTVVLNAQVGQSQGKVAVQILDPNKLNLAKEKLKRSALTMKTVAQSIPESVAPSVSSSLQQAAVATAVSAFSEPQEEHLPEQDIESNEEVESDVDVSLNSASDINDFDSTEDLNHDGSELNTAFHTESAPKALFEPENVKKQTLFEDPSEDTLEDSDLAYSELEDESPGDASATVSEDDEDEFSWDDLDDEF